jgi:undecaprenyl-diphosphatase
MLKALLELDKQLFILLNHGSGPFMDPVMIFLSGPIPWILFTLAVVFLVNKCQPWSGTCIPLFITIGSLILAVVLSEQISVRLFKNLFERLRPCHEPDLLGEVRLVAESCGGKYGFVSTHASNAFCLAILSSLILRRRWFTISVFIWAALISYSRVYLGVHYPGDVIGGMVLGLIIGFLTYSLYKSITGERGSPLRGQRIPKS